jgi:hypothetical protein
MNSSAIISPWGTAIFQSALRSRNSSFRIQLQVYQSVVEKQFVAHKKTGACTAATGV